MTQISLHQINEGMRQARIERAKALEFGVRFICNKAADAVVKVAIRIVMTVRAGAHINH
ncbi:MAG: hypothetical protein V7695_05280 [Sulfitobacter sp.]